MLKRVGNSWVPLGSFVLAVGLAFVAGPTLSAVGKQAAGDCIKWTLNKLVGNPIGGGAGIKVQANVTGTSQGDWKNPKANTSTMKVLVPFTITITGGAGGPVKATNVLPFNVTPVNNLGEVQTATTTTYDVVGIIDMGAVKDGVKSQSGTVKNPDGTTTETVASGQGQWSLVIEVHGTATKNVSGVEFCQDSATFNVKINDLKPSK